MFLAGNIKRRDRTIFKGDNAEFKVWFLYVSFRCTKEYLRSFVGTVIRPIRQLETYNAT